MLLGNRVESIGFEPDRSSHVNPTPLQRPTQPHSDIDPSQSNVLDLAEWRKRRSNQAKPPVDRSGSPKDNTPGDSGW